MFDRDFQQLAFLGRIGERCIGLLHPQMDLLADKLQAGVAHQRSGQQARLTENLKAVADAEDETAVVRELHDTAHDRRKTRHGAAAQIIAVGKSARQNDAVIISRKLVFVPEQLDLLTQLQLEAVENVMIVTGTWKYDDTPTHIQCGAM